MNPWEDYVARFYQLPFAQKEREWERLTDEQREALEGAAKRLPLGPMVPEDAHGGIASLSIRGMAYLIDLTVVLGLAGCGVGLGGLFPSSREAPLSLGLVLGFGYFVLRDALPGGRSLGKRACGLAVIDWATGAPCTVLQSLWRNLAHLGGVFDWGAALRASRRRVGDDFARTAVVEAAERRFAP